MQSLPPITIEVAGKSFRAELPTFFTQLAINAERDRIISRVLMANAELNGEQYTPDMLSSVSQATLNYAMLLATFTQTVQQPLPEGFSVSDLQGSWTREESENFLIEYWRQLKEKEASFRKDSQGSTGEQVPAMGPLG
jgi:hypothetical protein